MLAVVKLRGEIELSGTSQVGHSMYRVSQGRKSGMTRETDHKLVSLGCSMTLQAR